MVIGYCARCMVNRTRHTCSMNYTLKATKIELTKEMNAYVEKKMVILQKLIAHFGPAVTVFVEVERTTRHHRKGDVFRVEVRVNAPHTNMRAEALGQTVFEAMDAVKDEVAFELERHKEKEVDLKKRGARTMKRMIQEA